PGYPRSSTALSTTVYGGGGACRRRSSPWVDQARRCCLIRLVSSVTWLNVERRSAICWRIFLLACITVVWSRPPKSCPIFGSGSSVSSRHRYVAIWRAVASTREQEALDRASIVTPEKGEVWAR